MQALLIIDLQNDFLSLGIMSVPDGERIIPLINELQTKFDIILASQEWHPKNHISFASRHGKKVGESLFIENQKVDLFPDHCVQNSWGADFSSKLDSSKIKKVFLKGSDPDFDSHSAFFDKKNRETGLLDFLEKNKITQIFIVGLALEYCVMATALDGVRLGFETFVVKELCAALNKNIEEKIFVKMQKEGVKVVSIEEVLSYLNKSKV